VIIEKNILKSCWKVLKYKVLYFFDENYLPELNDLILLARFSKTDELTKIVERKITSIGDYQTSFWPNFKLSGFYRARFHNHLKGNIKKNILNEFNHEGEFWNPPAEITPIGRCNDKGESLLYCSTSWETAILESRPKVGEFISVTSFNLKDKEKNPYVVQGSRLNPIGIQYLSQIDSLIENEMFADYDFENRSYDYKNLDIFLDDLFHLKTKNKNKYLYKLSVAVTKCMMKNLQMGNAIKPMHGMIYSSIERDKKNYNIVFRPNHARVMFSIYEIQTFEITEVNEELIKLKIKRIGMTYGTKNHPLDNLNVFWKDLTPENQVEDILKLNE